MSVVFKSFILPVVPQLVGALAGENPLHFVTSSLGVEHYFFDILIGVMTRRQIVGTTSTVSNALSFTVSIIMVYTRSFLLVLVACFSFLDRSFAWVESSFSRSQSIIGTVQKSRVLPILGASRTEATNNTMEIHAADTSRGSHTSLAGDFAIVVSNTGVEPKWSLFPIDQVLGKQDFQSSGARSLQSLILAHETKTPPTAVLSSVLERDGVLGIRLISDTASVRTVDATLMDVLQRIFVQWVVSATDLVPKGPSITVSFYQEDAENIVLDLSSESGSKALFEGIMDDSTVEWVDMVTGRRQPLGQVPRRFVHNFNLLHRGVGLFVTKDESIDPANNILPDIYVHRRASTKRIFPSLYDMFVGGVSLSGESPALTARREVAEELGLNRALEDEDALSDALFDCTVCTSYNRCVVTLFSYTMKSREEAIAWQEEEVDWGSFIPYPIVVAAADRSIKRLAAKNEWPSSYPLTPSMGTELQASEVTFDDASWKQWDFVPDGLQVWAAWLEYIAKAKL
jgi:8-oxo-dGTP pyrophosphatase MutT (NUDIX family)